MPRNPLSLWNFYLRNKRKVVPVVGILALAILGVVVTDSLLASARETAYATYGSYQRLILVAPRATRDQDLAQPLQDSLNQLHSVQGEVAKLGGAGPLADYGEALAALPSKVRIQVPSLDRLQRDASTGRYYAARLQGDLVPLEQLIRQVQRIQSEERAFTQLESQLARNPRDISPLINYVRQHQTLLRSGLPDSWSLGRLQATVATTSADVLGLSRALGAVAQDAAAIQAAGGAEAQLRLPRLPPPPTADQLLGPFERALGNLAATLGSFEAPQANLDALSARATAIPGADFVHRDAYSELDINLLAGNAQFDLYGLSQPAMRELLDLYGDRVHQGRLPRTDASEVALSAEIARARNVGLGGKVGNNIDELDRLPDAFTVVGIIDGPTRVGIIPFEYMTDHYLFERRYEGLIVAPHPGQETQVHEALTRLIGDKPFRLFDWPYIKAKIDSLIRNLETINHFLILLVTIVLSLVVGLLNNLFFRQRMNEFGLLAAIGYTRWRLIARVALESLGVTLAAWILGIGLGVGVLWWFNQSFMVPHGLLLNVFNWTVLLWHTLPIPAMVFIFGMGTVGWQLLRLDPISIIERRD